MSSDTSQSVPDPDDRPPSDRGATATRARKNGSFFRELPFLVVVAFVLALLIKAFLVQAFYIPSGSMQQTLELRDRVLVNKLVYDFREIHRGEVVVFNGLDSFTPETEIAPPRNGVERVLRVVAGAIGVGAPGEKDFIKRVIGVPGDVLFARNGKLWRNGEQLNESYLRPDTKTSSFGPVRVPEGHIWVMGDNREDSQDSRKFGPVDQDVLVGRAMVLIWPFDHVGKL